MTILTLAYDMRAPDFGPPPAELYKAALDQCEWADQLGFKQVLFMEHHATTDGYLPSPLIMAAAAAARTNQMLIGLNIMQLPFYHAVRAAEDLAVLDLVSGGRLRITVGAGYRPEEYALFGLDFKKRPTLMTRGIETLKKAWTGEPFEFEGQEVRVLPRPAQSPRPAIVMGGSSRGAAERASRIADGYHPPTEELYADYREAMAALGKEASPFAAYRRSTLFLHVAEDPEAAWAKILPNLLHANNNYASWMSDRRHTAPFDAAADGQALRATGKFKVLTPEQCVQLARADGMLYFTPLTGGIDPSIAWESLHLFEREVLPRLREG